MTETSQTTNGSTGSSTPGSTDNSTVFSSSKKWKKEEIEKLLNVQVQNDFFIASKRKQLAAFMQKYFPGRSVMAVRLKFWQLKHGVVKYCKSCGQYLVK